MKYFFTLLAMLLSSSFAFAESFSDGSFTFVTTSENEVELSVADITDGEVTIPSIVTHDGKSYTVVSIGENAFQRKSITSVEMPNTITRIGSQAFQFCMQLKKAHLSENLETIGASAFQTTRQLSEINWPKTLKAVNSSAFLYSTSFTGQIWLPKEVAIGDDAFSNMSKATSLWINGQPKEWGSNVCEGCSNLSQLYVNCLYPPLFDPADTFPIDEWGWDDPVAMTLYVPRGAKENYLANKNWTDRFEDIIEMDFSDPDTTNPNGGNDDPSDREYETYIDSWSADFSEATLNVAVAGSLPTLIADHKDTLSKIKLSGKLNGDDILCLRRLSGADIDGAFIDGAHLSSIDLSNAEIVEGGSAYFSYLSTHFTTQDVVGPEMFSSCYSIEEFVMPKYAVEIGSKAFDNVRSLSSFTFSNYVKKIGELAFYNCVLLEEVEIPDSCVEFGEMVFYTCYSLKKVTLPASLNAIPFATFYFCKSLCDIEIPSTVKRIDNLAFHQCVSLESINIPAATYMIDANAFGYCESLTAINVDPENADYSDIDGVLLNKNKTKLISYPMGKDDERYVTPDGIVSVEANALAHALFKELIISEGVTTMAAGSCEDCKNLLEVYIPSTLTSIKDVFNGCAALQNFNVAVGNQSYSDIDGVLTDAEGKTLILYPYGRLETTYTTPEGIKEIGEAAFLYNEAIQEVVFSEGIETIGTNAFAYCSSLSKIDLPSSVTLLKEGSFGMTVLESIHCMAVTPPECEYYEDEDGVAYPFVGVNTGNCRLFVPEQSIGAYKADNVWKRFSIQELSTVESTEITSSEIMNVYDLSGKASHLNNNGVKIIRLSDGSVIKLMR